MKKIIENLEAYVRKEHGQREYALDKFLEYLLELFDYKYYHTGWQKHVNEMNEKSPELMTAAIEWLELTSTEIEKGGWCDTLGRLYEAMYQSKGKASALGQFYTPECLCDLMAKVTYKESDIPHISDCACGSGRTLLAAYNKYREGYYTGEDLDGMSVRMCALNLMVHGARGRAVCHDTLRSPVNFDWGYEINEVRYPFPTPYYSVRRISNPEPKEEITKPIQHTEKEDHKYKPGDQMSLF